MSLLDTLVDFFSRSPDDTRGDTPDGLCPNCWGRDEYDGQVRDVAKDRQINVNNHQERYAFIQQFVVNHVDGIRLKNHGGRTVCDTCKANYQAAGR